MRSPVFIAREAKAPRPGCTGRKAQDCMRDGFQALLTVHSLSRFMT